MPFSNVIIVGGGPGGLIAAEILAKYGFQVSLYERNPWVGRKLLVAGKSGLNLTNNKPMPEFLDQYGVYRPALETCLTEFPPLILRQWADDLGVKTFIGSSGKVFPKGMKAAPLLAAWKLRLDGLGVRTCFQHTFTQIDPISRVVTFNSPNGFETIEYDAILFALGGGSWPVTGSTGDWGSVFEKWGINCDPLKPTNMGFNVAWTARLLEKFEGTPIKTVAISFTDAKGERKTRLGEFVITRYGLEGNLIYALSAAMRDAIALNGPLRIELNLLPNMEAASIGEKLRRMDPKRSLSTNLARHLSLPKEKIALLWESRHDLNQLTPTELAVLIVNCPITLQHPRPLDEAISSAGGIQMEQLDDFFMSKKYPGLFFVGEMLDWEAPTGGYLLNGVMATAVRAAKGIVKMLSDQP